MKTNLLPQEWLCLSPRERMRMIEIFSIPKSEGVVMQDNTILSDGHTVKDLRAISIETMQKYLGSQETEFYRLLEAVKNKIAEEFVEIEKKEILDTRNLSITRLQNSVVELHKEAIRLGVYDDILWEAKVEEEPILKAKKGKK
jgi:hypothetical protein